MKTVTLTTEMWQKIIRRLTAQVGADDESRVWADCIKEQINGSVKVHVSTSRGVKIKGLK